MTQTLKQMMEAADASVPRIDVREAQALLAKGDVLLVDVRDAPEVARDGMAAGALNVSRGMLEFRADPASPYYYQQFSRDKTLILYCASGGRSALAGKTLKDMGYDRVFNLGAFKSWVEAGGAVDKPAG